VTLTMMIVAPWGVWACSDHRLTPLDGQRDIIDRSVKQIVLRTADGEVVITYAGIGSVDVHRGEDQWEQDVHISEWLRPLLRNDNWNLDQVQTMIRDWATAKWGPTWSAGGWRHWFLVGGFSRGRPVAAEITNASGPPGFGPLPRLEIKPYPAQEAPQLLIRGAGVGAISSDDRDLLDRITRRQPRRAKSWMRVLAGVHQRAQRSGGPGSATVSEGCLTTSMPPNYGTDETGHLEQVLHWERPDAGPDQALPPVPSLLFGLDLTAAWEADHHIRTYLDAGQEPPKDALERWSDAIKRGMLAPRDP
jgi:hypothetical protein